MLATAGHPWEKLKATNFTDASFPALVPRLGRPSGDGVISMKAEGQHGAPTQNAILFRFFGTGTNNQNFNARVYGWDACPNAKQPNYNTPYHFVLLAQLAITLGNLGGVANTGIEAADFEADTVVVTYGNDDIDISHNSNAGDVRGMYVRVDTMGCELVQVTFDRNSSAASANCLYKKL